MKSATHSASPKKYITTWLYLEGNKEGGIYPQVHGSSSSDTFQDIYKRCLITFFLSARSVEPEAILILFCNVDLRGSSREIDIRLLRRLDQVGVEIVLVGYTFLPPKEQLNWRNQFYVLDVLVYLSSRILFNDLVLIMDSDIIWTGSESTGELWKQLAVEGSLTMLPIQVLEESINGLTLQELNKLSRLLGFESESQIQYAGGEFIALRGDILREVLLESKSLWHKYQEALKNSNVTHMEEAHFLSLVYRRLGIRFGSGDLFIRRIWTQVFHYSNRLTSDIHLVCWHLPAEKRFGLRRVADRFLENPDLVWPKRGSLEWLEIRNGVGIPVTSFGKGFRDILKSIRDRILRN